MIRRPVEDRFDFRTIRKPHRSAGGVERKMMDEIAGEETGFVSQDRLQLPDITKLGAIEEFPRRIDGL